MTTSEQTTIIKPEKDIVASCVDELKKEVLGHIQGGSKEIVFDLDQVSLIDSSGIGLIIASQNQIKKDGGEVKVINASEDILKMFKIMRLDKHLNISAKA